MTALPDWMILSEAGLTAEDYEALPEEVMSPGSVTADQADKPAEYAAAGIEHFWRVERPGDGELTVFRYRLDPTTRGYASAGISTDKLTVNGPFPVSVDLGELI